MSTAKTCTAGSHTFERGCAYGPKLFRFASEAFLWRVAINDYLGYGERALTELAQREQWASEARGRAIQAAAAERRRIARAVTQHLIRHDTPATEYRLAA